MFYVSIDGIDDSTLRFLGYDLVAEDDQFKLYRHVHTGNEYIVEKANPRLGVEDVNDANLLAARSTSKTVTVGPKYTPKPDP